MQPPAAHMKPQPHACIVACTPSMLANAGSKQHCILHCRLLKRARAALGLGRTRTGGEMCRGLGGVAMHDGDHVGAVSSALALSSVGHHRAGLGTAPAQATWAAIDMGSRATWAAGNMGSRATWEAGQCVEGGADAVPFCMLHVRTLMHACGHIHTRPP